MYQRREVFEFAQTHSWLDVGQQVLRRSGRSPGGSQVHALNVIRAPPPTCGEASSYPERIPEGGVEPDPRERIDPYTPLVRVCAGVMCVDRLYATTAVLPVGPVAQFCGGVVRGRKLSLGAHVYIREAVILHALRVLREWLVTAPHTLLRGL